LIQELLDIDYKHLLVVASHPSLPPKGAILEVKVNIFAPVAGGSITRE
jgi:hypothetical protein